MDIMQMSYNGCILALDSLVILYSVLMLWILVPSAGECIKDPSKNAKNKHPVIFAIYFISQSTNKIHLSIM